VGVQKPHVSGALPRVAKNPSNLLATLVLLGELQPLVKPLVGVKTPINAKFNPN